MAYDPHRDLVPVRDSGNFRFGRGSHDRFDYQILGKLSRSDLEDKFLRLLDEKTQLKILVNGQDEKIKRLGTKLLRIINEKKIGKKNLDKNKETEDLHIRIIELEHENYALKDKNIVLKQQLSSHSGHTFYHRSPIRSNHTSPLMSVRKTPAAHNEVSYNSANKNPPAELQLEEAKGHIQELNNEIKLLHGKLQDLQENFEKNSLDNQKLRVSENIELIRLQRSLKQQEIQIISLQAQVKNSENSQKVLKQELIKAHNENDEALNVISEKQVEILCLCNKLDEKNLNRLEEDELKERINDLMAERDSLKDRSSLLLKTIENNCEDNEEMRELKRLLVEEKCQKKKSEDALSELEKNYQMLLEETKQYISQSCQFPSDVVSEDSIDGKEKFYHVKFASQRDNYVQTESFHDGSSALDETMEHMELCCQCARAYFASQKEGNYTGVPVDGNQNLQPETSNPRLQTAEGKYYAENVKLEHEVQHLREMLRNQTARVEAQQTEISRLMYELRVNEEKANDTLLNLDMHLKIFQQLDLKAQKNDLNSVNQVKVMRSVNEVNSVKLADSEKKVGESWEEKAEESLEEKAEVPSEEKTPPTNVYQNEMESLGTEPISGASVKQNMSSTKTFSFTFQNLRKDRDTSVETSKLNNSESEVKPMPKKRFVEQVFLESSEESDNEIKLEDLVEKDKINNEKIKKDESNLLQEKDKFGELTTPSETTAFQSDKAFSEENRGVEALRPKGGRRSSNTLEQVMINTLWLKLNPDTSLMKNDKVTLLFVDFTFLDVRGEETETPESLPKPQVGEKSKFNFVKTLNLSESKKKTLQSLLTNYEHELIVFKVVSDPEDSTGESDCLDVGVAAITVREFLENRGLDFFEISVKNVNDPSEVLGKLAVGVDATPGIFKIRNN